MILFKAIYAILKTIHMLLKGGWWFVKGVFALIGFLLLAFVAVLGG